jgi:signal transduction histidine kinase
MPPAADYRFGRRGAVRQGERSLSHCAMTGSPAEAPTLRGFAIATRRQEQSAPAGFASAWLQSRRARAEARERERLARQAEEALQGERSRIATELHDGIVQDLAGPAFALHAATAGAVHRQRQRRG